MGFPRSQRAGYFNRPNWLVTRIMTGSDLNDASESVEQFNRRAEVLRSSFKGREIRDVILVDGFEPGYPSIAFKRR